jgi:hypothetical protein
MEKTEQTRVRKNRGIIRKNRRRRKIKVQGNKSKLTSKKNEKQSIM